MRRRRAMQYGVLGILAVVTFANGGWWRVVALGMVMVGVGCWLWEHRKAKLLPLLATGLLVVPSLTACDGVPEHPIPVAMQAVAPTADTGCVVAVGVTGFAAIYTFGTAPLDWVGVTLFGAGLPSLSDCWYEFDASRMQLRVWYDCGQGPRWFTATSMTYITDQFQKGHCNSQTGNYMPWIEVF